MTESKALKRLKAYKECLKLQTLGNAEICSRDDCDECSLCYGIGTAGEHRDAIKIAIKALEKQIAKKPRKVSLTQLYCPECDRRLRSGNGSSARGRDYYCQRCGQAIDFGE